MKIGFQSISDMLKNGTAPYLAALPETRQKELLAMRNEKGMLQSLAGEWLVRTLLEEETGEEKSSFIIVRDGQKKPYLAGNSLYFNISHSNDYVMAAVSSRPIGVDMESCERDAARALRRVCTGEDLEYISQGTEPEKQVRMMKMWTRKEALVKCIGTGITDRRMYCVVGTGNKELHIDGMQYRLSSPKAPEGYCCAVCEFISDVKK